MTSAKRPDYKKSRPVRIFFSYFKPHWKLFLIDMLCATLICVVDLAFPYVSRNAMQVLIPTNQFRAFFTVMTTAQWSNCQITKIGGICWKTVRWL